MHLLTSMRYTQKIMHVHMIRHELKMHIGKKILKHNQFIYYFRVRLEIPARRYRAMTCRPVYIFLIEWNYMRYMVSTVLDNILGLCWSAKTVNYVWVAFSLSTCASMSFLSLPSCLAMKFVRHKEHSTLRYTYASDIHNHSLGVNLVWGNLLLHNLHTYKRSFSYMNEY